MSPRDDLYEPSRSEALTEALCWAIVAGKVEETTDQLLDAGFDEEEISEEIRRLDLLSPEK